MLVSGNAGDQKNLQLAAANLFFFNPEILFLIFLHSRFFACLFFKMKSISPKRTFGYTGGER